MFSSLVGIAVFMALRPFSAIPLAPEHERVCLMNTAKFKIGESVDRIMRVNQGRFLVVTVTTQPAGNKIRYLIRSQDDGNIERLVDESELSTT
jgi:hypothetical protein